MHRDRSGARQSHQSHSSGRSGSQPTREYGRKHHRESRREKIDLLFEDSNYESEASTENHGSGRRGGGFEMGVVSSGRRMEEESNQWLPAALQTTPSAPPTYQSLTPGSSKAEDEFPAWGETEEEKKDEPQAPLWQEGWKPAGPLTVSIPRLHVFTPSIKHTADTTRVSSALDFPRDRDGNNLILHGMGLQSYITEVKEMLSSLPEETIMETSNVDSLPKKPTKFGPSNPKLPASNPLSQPAMVPHLSLSKQSLGKLRRKSVAAMCSFAGYESSSPEALEILSDVLGSFLSDFSKILKLNADQTPGGHVGCRGFHDTLERSLHQLGIEGRSGLRCYWQESVVDYTRQLDMEADEYRSTYLSLTVPEEKTQKSSPADTVSGPFAESRLFSDQHLNPSREEGMPLDFIMQQSRIAIATQGAGQSSPDAPPVLVPVVDPEMVLPDSERLLPLEPDMPQ